jgi:hypothetical protein
LTRVLCFYISEPIDMKPSQIYIDPSFSESRKPIEDYTLISDDRVRAAYLDVLDTYNKGAYRAIPPVVGRALEGIVKDRLKGEKDVDLSKVRMLGPLLEKLSNVDLAQPLRDLATALKDGRNIGTHFDLDVEPDEKMSIRMLDLLEVIVEYIYILPAQVMDFGRYITKEETPTDSQ